MTKREVVVDWVEVLTSLTDGGMNDSQISMALQRHGAQVNTTTIWNLRHGRTQKPSYAMGAALLNLWDERTLRRFR